MRNELVLNPNPNPNFGKKCLVGLLRFSYWETWTWRLGDLETWRLTASIRSVQLRGTHCNSCCRQTRTHPLWSKST